MRTTDKRISLSRRGFLATGGAAATAVSVLAGGKVLLDPNGAWAMGLGTLKPETARTLIQMARDLYPHDRLGDAYYVKAIEPYDAAAARDPALLKLLTEGTLSLDRAAAARGAKSYADMADEQERVAILRDAQSTPFFKKIRADMITGLYNNPDVWVKLGYEGPSAEKGGYIERGFNDIDWLKA